MLQFILGKPSTGKTYTVLQKIKEHQQKNDKTLLIVPEQLTFQIEKAILQTVGDKAALDTTVLSFTRLYDEVTRAFGGASGKLLSDAEKIIFMHKALLSAKEDLTLWKKYVNSVSFAKSVLDTIGEFKINAITPKDVKNASEALENKNLAAKLSDIAKIYEHYDLELKEKYVDPADLLTRLYEKLKLHNFFEGKTVFIDGFHGFTGQQFKIIERILQGADKLYITFSYDRESDRDFGIFTNIRLDMEKIKRIAASRAVDCEEPIILKQQYYENDALLNVESVISGNKPLNEKNEGINILNLPTVFDEADYALSEIRRLVREENYRFRDFVIICRDIEQYKEAVTSAAKRNKVNLFYDSRLPLVSFPVSVAVEAAIKSLNFSTENILRFHKTGLTSLTTEEIATLENYTYLWKINGNVWQTEWDMNPNGFVTDEADEKLAAELVTINELREKALWPIIKLKSDFGDNAKAMATAILKLFENCNFSERLLKLKNNFKLDDILFSENILEQSYDAYIGILESLVSSFGDKSLSATEFLEALMLAVSLTDIGTVPQLLDQVTFGAADRIRPVRPKITFILGANQGVFPKNASSSGVFNNIERRILIQNDLPIADNAVLSAIDEEFLVYTNICSPSKALYLLFAEQSVSSARFEAASFVKELSSNLKISIKKILNNDFSLKNLPETPDVLISDFCRAVSADSEYKSTLLSAIDKADLRDKVEFLMNDQSKELAKISPDTAKRLFGSNITMSASKFDTFNYCKFSFFCRYGLNLRRLQPADFDVMQKGTIVHYVLERFITENKEQISQLSDSQTDLLTDKYIEDYLASVKGFSTVRDINADFIISRISRSLKDVVRHIKKEISQSDFKPVACEVKIGFNPDEINVSFPFDSGKIGLMGSIDRMDEYNGYIRIIDYKTGKKKFALPDILLGLNMQMLIYLYAVIRGKNLPDDKAAGILYQPASRDIKDDGLAMNGLLQNDPQLLSAMESDAAGEYIPKISYNKDGSLSKKSKSFIPKENFTEIFDLIERLMTKTGNTIHSGDIAVKPVNGRYSSACDYCDFKSVCNFDSGVFERAVELTNDQVFEKIGEVK